MKSVKRFSTRAMINRGANYREGIHHAARGENNEPVNSGEEEAARQMEDCEECSLIIAQSLLFP